MIPWHLSNWSTSDALAAVGLTHEPHANPLGIGGARAIKRGEDVEIVGTVTTVNDWLHESGQVQRWAVSS